MTFDPRTATADLARVFTYRQMGKRLNVSQGTIGRWISGETNPNGEHRENLRAWHAEMKLVQAARNVPETVRESAV